MATTTDEIDFDLSQFDDTLISDQQKQNLIDYIHQIKSQKRAIGEEFDQLKLSTGSVESFFSLRRFILQYYHFSTARTNECFCCFLFCSFFCLL